MHARANRMMRAMCSSRFVQAYGRLDVLNVSGDLAMRAATDRHCEDRIGVVGTWCGRGDRIAYRDGRAGDIRHGRLGRCRLSSVTVCLGRR